MWASAPTNNRAKLHDFVGRTESSAPTKGVENHACPAKIAAFPVSCRRGRCPHRPTESIYFMAVFRRIRGIVIPRRRGRCPHRPAESTYFMAVFRRIREIAVPRRRGGRLCPPAENARFCGNPMRNCNILKRLAKRRILQAQTPRRVHRGRASCPSGHTLTGCACGC